MALQRCCLSSCVGSVVSCACLSGVKVSIVEHCYYSALLLFRPLALPCLAAWCLFVSVCAHMRCIVVAGALFVLLLLLRCRFQPAPCVCEVIVLFAFMLCCVSHVEQRVWS